MPYITEIEYQQIAESAHQAAARNAELEAALKEAIGIAHDAALVLPPKASTTEYIRERVDALREILKRK